MSFFIFDMDETLAEMLPTYYFIASLKLKQTLEDSGDEQANDIPEDITNALTNAYQCFVKKVLERETSNPLGILRPGILSVMKKLYKLQQNGAVKYVIIYSNNGHLQSLNFVRDLIHLFLGTNNLIKECIHFDHPMRAIERNDDETNADKTWFVLKYILVNGNCKAKAANITPSNVYFFDDLEHQNLKEALQDNYYQVPAYDYVAPIDEIAEIWKECITAYLEDDQVSVYAQVLNYLFFNKLNSVTLDEITEKFKENSEDPYEREIQHLDTVAVDDGISMMNDAIVKVKSKFQEGGRRRHKKDTKKRRYKLRITIKKLNNKNVGK
jgi:hypothetical protein